MIIRRRPGAVPWAIEYTDSRGQKLVTVAYGKTELLGFLKYRGIECSEDQLRVLTTMKTGEGLEVRG